MTNPNQALDALWTPVSAEEYVERCRRRRLARRRRRNAAIQRLLTISLGLFAWACVLALIVG